MLSTHIRKAVINRGIISEVKEMSEPTLLLLLATQLHSILQCSSPSFQKIKSKEEREVSEISLMSTMFLGSNLEKKSSWRCAHQTRDCFKRRKWAFYSLVGLMLRKQTCSSFLWIYRRRERKYRGKNGAKREDENGAHYIFRFYVAMCRCFLWINRRP